MGEKPLSLQPDPPQTHRENENICVALENKEGKGTINGLTATMADACRTYCIYAGTIFSPSAYGLPPLPPQDSWRCGQGPQLHRRQEKEMPRDRRGTIDCSASRGRDEILTTSWDRALATLHLVLVAKLAGADNFPACSVLLGGKSEKCLPSVQGRSTILFLAGVISAPQRRASKASVVRQGFT